MPGTDIPVYLAPADTHSLRAPGSELTAAHSLVAPVLSLAGIDSGCIARYTGSVRTAAVSLQWRWDMVYDRAV
jgi:hypothetical protein